MKLISVLLAFALFSQADSNVREKLSELHELREQIRKAVFEKSRFQDEVARLQIEVEKQNERMTLLQQDQSELKEKILSRVEGLYKLHRLQPQGSLMQLLGSHDFLKKTFYLKYMNEQDKGLIQEYQGKTKSLQKEKAQYAKRLAYFRKLKQRAQSRHLELRTQEQKQRDLISAIRLSVQSAQSSDPLAPFFSEKRGKLKPPTTGIMKSNFGLRRDRKNDLNHLETGIYYQTSEGTDVLSVSSGEVVFLDHVPGWGLTLILDHGEFYYSVYSHLKNPSVRPGEKVQDNQKLAVVGRSSYDKNENLYFEIRHFSEPQDPEEWIERGTL